MKQFVAFSGGVESTTCCLLFGHKAKAIFADAGWEHAVMYDRITEVESVIKAKRPGFEVIRVRAENVEGTGTNSLPDYIRHRKYYPSPLARFCTRLFKIEPIDKFLSSQGECELMIGLNYDERDSREGNHGLLSNVTYSYPLIDLKLTRADCIRILKEHNLMPDFPPYMSRGGCVGCFFKKKRELASLAIEAPEEMSQVVEIEKAIQDKRGGVLSPAFVDQRHGAVCQGSRGDSKASTETVR
jgi:3'-phosphoadenosine 5'-phosphosulfate sulfotransferase (PAPS reductase)/FAD synthetase